MKKVTETQVKKKIVDLNPIELAYACAKYVDPIVNGKTYFEIRHHDLRKHGRGGCLQVFVTDRRTKASYDYSLNPVRTVRYMEHFKISVSPFSEEESGSAWIAEDCLHETELYSYGNTATVAVHVLALLIVCLENNDLENNEVELPEDFVLSANS